MEETIAAAWGAPVHLAYMASESVDIGIRGPGDVELTLLDDLNIVEILDSGQRAVGPGESGRVVQTLRMDGPPSSRPALASSSAPVRPDRVTPTNLEHPTPAPARIGHHHSGAARGTTMIRPAHPFVEFALAATEQSISARFEQQVARYPTRLAVQTRQRRFTYAALNGLANRVARTILARSGEAEEAVALIHLGRKDAGVKILGYRVDIDEIEAALLDSPRVRHAVVTARQDRAGDLRLVAYVVLSQPWPTAARDVSEHLRQTLPLHMVPAVFIFLDALPVLPHGKVNYAALPLPDDGRPGHLGAVVAPRTPLETTLVGIWTQVLGFDRVGIRDDFLALGGDSLNAIQVIARVLARLSVDLPVRVLFETPTIAEMAIAITHQVAEQGSPEVLAAILSALEERSEGRRALFPRSEFRMTGASATRRPER